MRTARAIGSGLLVALAFVGFAACGGDDDGGDEAATSETTAPDSTTTTADTGSLDDFCTAYADFKEASGPPIDAAAVVAALSAMADSAPDEVADPVAVLRAAQGSNEVTEDRADAGVALAQFALGRCDAP